MEKPGRDANSPVPRLAIVDSPYRQIHQPILDFIAKTRKEKPDQLIAMIIPGLVEPHAIVIARHPTNAITGETKISTSICCTICMESG